MELINPDSRQALIGSVLILLGAIGFSSKSILIKLAYADSAQIEPITLMALRMMLSLPFFLAVALWDRQPGKSEYHSRDWIALILLGLMGYYLASLLDFTGLKYISAGLERLILFLYPTIVVLLTARLYRRPISRLQGWALLLSYIGILLAFGYGQQTQATDLLLGSGLVFASAVVFAFFMTGSGHFIPRFGSRRYTAYTMSIAAVATLVHFIATHPIETLLVSNEVFGLAVLLALFATVAPAFLMSAGIHRIGAGRTSIISTVGPVATLALAYVVLGETLGPFQLIASALVLGGVLLVSQGK